MTQKLAKMVAIVALALTPLIGSGVANAHGIGSGSAGFHNSGWLATDGMAAFIAIIDVFLSATTDTALAT